MTRAPDLHTGGRLASGAAEGSNGRARGKLLDANGRPSAHGKFLFAGGQKLYIRGTTYGTFSPGADGQLYPAPEVVARDFAQMASNGFNAVRTYTVPPRWLLDVAAENGLFVMVGIAWEQHVDFLEGRQRARSIESRIRAGVAACAGHAAVLSYSVGNEIPSEMVRWLGRRRVERYIARLYRAAKDEDPDGLVTYVNYPPTEYLQLPFLDFVSFNVYLEARTALAAYLARLHNVTGDRPLLMAEIGLDSRSHGELAQASVLDWQIRAAFNAGCAGAFVFAWTDDWYVSYLSELTAPGGLQIDDWDFGLTRRDRCPKPALQAVATAFEEAPVGLATTWPRASVVVCTFNGEATIRECLQGLRELDYPNFEVIVVDDGSTDSTPAIVSEYEVRLINLQHGGLAEARNIGMQAASGEIVAYLDDDARPDPQWLRYLVGTLEQPHFAGAGGPNLPPTSSGTVARCVADAPGGPVHVLLSDIEAEHLPGCNMGFRKAALEAIGGFDPQFDAAGDDVDLCWRLLEAGHKLGFSPSAVVWHRPRPSVRAYWRQQRGYGRAEAMLERKWPQRYRTGGGAHWRGRIYARALHGLGRWRVYYGTWGSELFQALYAPDGPTPSSLLGRPEPYLWAAGLAFLSVTGLLWPPLLLVAPLPLAMLTASVVLSAVGAARSASAGRPRRRRDRALRCVLTTLLHLTQPLARITGRLGSERAAARSRPRHFELPLPRVLTTWTESWQPREERLSALEASLRERGAIVARGGAYDRWDLQARRTFISALRICVGIEEHGAGRQLVRVNLKPCYSPSVLGLVALLAAVSLLALLDGAQPAALLLAAGAAALGGCAVRSAGLAMGSVLHVASDRGLPARREVGSVQLETP